MVFWDIPPLCNKHPGATEINVLLLTDVSADPEKRLRLAVVIHLIGYLTNTSCDVIVTP